MSKIVQLKKQNEDIYPRTLDKAVLVSGTTTLDEYLNDLNTIIEEDELVISNALNDLNTRVSDTYTISETDSLISGFFDGANYDSNTKKIYFTHSGVTKAQIDATDFIKDGMVDNVVVSGGNLVITFNTDAGKEDISIPLSSIFDPSLYYTSAQTDILLDEKQDTLTAGTGIAISGNVISSTVEVPQSLRIMGLTPSGHTLADNIDDYYTNELNEGEVGAWFITYSDGNILIPPQTETDAQGRVKLSDDWYSTLNYAGATWANVGDILLVYELAEGFAAYKILTLNEAGETRVGLMSPNDKIKVNQIDHKLPYSTDSVYAGGVTDGAYTNVTTGRSNWIDSSAAGSMVSLGNLQFAVDPSGRLYSRNKNLKNGTWNITEQLMTIGGRDVNTIYEPSVVGYGVCPNAPTTNPVTVYTFASADLDGNGYRSLLQIVTDRTTSEQYIRTAFYKPENGDFTYTNWVKITGYDDFEELRNIVIDNEYVTATALNALEENKQDVLTAGEGIEICGTTISCTLDPDVTTEDVRARIAGSGELTEYETLDKFDIHLLDFDHGFMGFIKDKDCESEIDWDDSDQTDTVDFIERLINFTAPNITPEDYTQYVVAPYILGLNYIDEDNNENNFMSVRSMVQIEPNGDDSYLFYLYLYNDTVTFTIEGEYSVDNNYAFLDNYCVSYFDSILGDVDGKIDNISQAINDQAYTVSSSLNDLNSRMIEVSGEVASVYSEIEDIGSGITSAISEIYSVIEEDELITSTALNNLNSRLTNEYYTSAETEDLIDELSGTKEVTYSALVALRNTSALTPGATYRITDYTTTTIQENTTSAENDFDVIVKALSNSEIDENARAIQHEGDTYFADSNLNAWEIKYCLDNDNSRFHWADSGNGKGVIYYMKDEYNNECHYDFKNIMFQRWAVSAITGNNVQQDLLDELEGVFVYDSEDQPTCYSYTGETYTLENITFGVDTSTSAYYYTFTWIDENGLIQDFSIEGNRIPTDDTYIDGCYGNSIGKTNEFALYTSEYSEDNLAFVLNNVVFVSTYSFNGGGTTYGTFSNHLGDGCYYNTFGNEVYSNIFGNYVFNNIFGNTVYNNTFGNDAAFNTFGNTVYSNTFGNDAGNNIFGSNVYNNTFGNGVGFNIFGNDVGFNAFGNDVNSNTFGSYVYNITFGNNVGENILGSFVKNIIVENGNLYITLSTSGTTSSSAFLQNIKISQGVNNANSELDRKTIVHPTLKDQFQTIYAKDSLGNIIGYNPADVQKVIAEALTDLDERLKSLEQSSVSYQ